MLGDYPRMGRVYEGRTHQFVHGKHIILYRTETNHVLIGRIFHGAQGRSGR
jgi:toxin ParE1/3/4